MSRTCSAVEAKELSLHSTVLNPNTLGCRTNARQSGCGGSERRTVYNFKSTMPVMPTSSTALMSFSIVSESIGIIALILISLPNMS